MGLGHAPAIILNGLSLAFDAGNIKSYPGTGTTWINLVDYTKNGTLVSNPTFNTGNLGHFTFNGTSSYVALGNVQDAVSNYTWAAWIKTTTNINAPNYYDGNVIIGTLQGAGDTGDVLLVVNNGLFAYYDESGFLSSYTVSSTKIVNDGIWHYVAAGKSGSNIKLWVDGVLGNEQSIGSESSNSSGLRIGSSDWSATNMFNGSVAVAHIYNRQLTTAEISQNFNALRGRFGV